MIEEGEPAPDFTVPIARGEAYNDVGEFSLSEHVGEGPVVLAFFPAAFTSGCTEEMCTFRDSLSAFEAVDASVYGLSTDLPFAQNEFIRQEGLTFPLLSDFEHEAIRAYGVVREDFYDVLFVAERSVFVLDERGTVVYRWVESESDTDFEALVGKVREVAETLSER
ncbi:redoxin domain-containing protein [Halalkalicoccus subterraneus]|uniref:redoxin domain-containing protein n=1 Tax=Halalkalicoccus subterraneus TaxID=2675002 RepID=UPI000EFB92EF|nr:redoxin domain-containing protein [Halalkalicoccus subterraneus]